MTPIHPALVHLPIGLAFVMPILILLFAFLLFRGRLPRWGWGVAFLLQGLLLGGGGLAFLSGSRDEDRVEKVVSERLIEGHEQAAVFFLVAAGLTLVLLGAVWAMKSDSGRRGLSVAAIVASFAVAGLGVNVGHRGGDLVYEHGAATAYAAPGGTAPATGESKADDD